MNCTIARIISLALAVLMCSAALTACASAPDDDTTVTTTTPAAGDIAPADTTPSGDAPSETTPAPEDIRITPNLPDADFKGHKFTVLTAASLLLPGTPATFTPKQSQATLSATLCTAVTN